jgi:hypothetical protein
VSRIYSIPFNGTITLAGTDTDIWSFQPADDKPIILRGFTLGQSTEISDSGEENLRITVKYLPATFTVGSGGSAVTAVSPPGDPGAAVWGFTARTNDTTVATSSGTVLIRDEFGWNVRNTPYEHWYPDERFAAFAAQAAGIIIRCESTVIDDLAFSGVAFVEES